MSPLRNQPSGAMASAVASGRFQYPRRMIVGPRNQISPVAPVGAGRPSGSTTPISTVGAGLAHLREPLVDPLHQLGRGRRAAVADALDRREVVALEVGRLDDPPHD